MVLEGEGVDGGEDVVIDGECGTSRKAPLTLGDVGAGSDKLPVTGGGRSR